MIRLSNERIDSSDNFGSAVLEKEPEVKEPPLYQVILINDDYTPMEFVVFVLQTFTQRLANILRVGCVTITKITNVHINTPIRV